jgi:hypothetical protein
MLPEFIMTIYRQPIPSSELLVPIRVQTSVRFTWNTMYGMNVIAPQRIGIFWAIPTGDFPPSWSLPSRVGRATFASTFFVLHLARR